jgi:hypothetical protein
MSEWRSVSKQISIKFTSQKEISSPRRLWKTEILPTCTIAILFDLMFSVRLDVKTCHCRESPGILGHDPDWFDLSDFLIFWRNLGTLKYKEAPTLRQSGTSQRIWIFSFTAVTHSSHTSLSCYKGPHTVTVIFGVQCMWRNRNREWGKCLLIKSDCLLVKSDCLLIKRYCLLIKSDCLLIKSDCLLIKSDCLLIKSDCHL